MDNSANGLSRRTFVNLGAALPFASLWWRGIAAAASSGQPAFENTGAHDFTAQPFRSNLYMAFNPIQNPENGESDEFTTIRNIERIMNEMGVPPGTHVIGIGARTGTPDNIYGMPGEMGYFWRYGEAWDGKITHPETAEPLSFGKDDPIPVTQIGILDPASAHRLEFRGGEARGSVMWSLENDETGLPRLGRGFHNIFSDRDGGMIETLYAAAQAAKANPTGWASPEWRQRLALHIPDLREERDWQNFLATFPRGLLHTACHAYAKQQQWQGAAVVIRGKLRNVAQFHLMEWNRKSPAEPNVEFGRGTHLGVLRVRVGRELRPFMTKEEGAWTMVGFLWDMDSHSHPGMSSWQDASDIFGNDFHIHGFRDDGKVGGHTLFCMLGDGDISVDLYPLQFEEGQGAYVLNNDLCLDPGSLRQEADGLSVTIRNDGELFARQVRVDLEQLKDGLLGRVAATETQVIPLLQPRESITVRFPGQAGLARDSKRRLTLDKVGHFFEGNGGTANNTVTFDAALRSL